MSRWGQASGSTFQRQEGGRHLCLGLVTSSWWPPPLRSAPVETGRLLHRILSPDFQVGSHTHSQTDGYHNGSKPQSLSGFEFYLDQSNLHLSLFLCSIAREIRPGRKSHFLIPLAQICHIVSSFLLNTLAQKVIFNPILLVNFEMPQLSIHTSGVAN